MAVGTRDDEIGIDIGGMLKKRVGGASSAGCEHVDRDLYAVAAR